MNETIKRLYVTGYQSYELGIFNEKDPRVQVIKNVLKRELTALIENGLEWVMISGNLGTEAWTGQVINELKVDYPELRLAIIFPFENFGSNWKEQNRLILSELVQRADFVESVSHQPYQNPGQFKNHVSFLLEHTDAALVVYDTEYPGKSKFFLGDVEKYQLKNSYDLLTITMDDLENSSELGDSV
ncbi:DUF1273 domain-containing protein [Enterococcus devriesei]|uniref:DUF1273 domain-containing protein n=1 Tax=Enterococcus devriesei TaxID=319970 RepID=UPI001C10EC16|nr:DUF1273 domain-containing protein [Enterococcus devriesei]MBU5364765.1 DUF1273 domain-containing protein [Enterococcus devriesei]MDT2820356.1 DUF1273 domain-containing protein [Enterococcus devriesei]